MEKPIISVVMPVYNGDKYLKEAIDSILNQSYKNFEFIIINDGSTDASESIISVYSDARIRYFYQENSGIGSALRKGCNLAQGIYIARMDADDVSFPNRFELQKKYLDKNPNIVLVSNSVIYIDEFGKTIGRSFTYSTNYAITKKFKHGSSICHPSVMMRKDAYFSAGGYIDLQPCEDLYLWMKLSQKGDFHNLRSTLLKYRILNNSISRSITKKHINILVRYLNNITNKDILSEKDIDEFSKLYIQAKIEVVSLGNNTSKDPINKFHLFSKMEYYIFIFLKKLRLPESMIEFIICTLKNSFIYFQYK